MKYPLVVCIVFLSTNIFCQGLKGIDIVVYDTISTEKYCEIFNDSTMGALTNYDETYDKLLLLALAWNTRVENYGMLQRKNIDLCGHRFDSVKSDVWERFYLYIDDFWGSGLLFFKMVICA